MSSHVADFNIRNQILTAKLLKQCYRYHELRKTFSKFYRRHYNLVFNFNMGLKSLLKQGLSETEIYNFISHWLYGDFISSDHCLSFYLVYIFNKIVGRNDFSDQFRKIIIRYKRIRYY